LILHKPFEAHTAVKKRSVEVEDDCLEPDEMAHDRPFTRSICGSPDVGTAWPIAQAPHVQPTAC
jgi:hypothetical protein